MASTSEKPVFDVNEAEKLFEQFVKDHNKQYKDAEERETRYQIFVKSLHKINKLNSESPSATYGINKFADYTEDEMKYMCGTRSK